jgi:hypothetical protein
MGAGAFGVGAEEGPVGRLFCCPPGDVGELFSKGLKPKPAAPAGKARNKLKRMGKNLYITSF